MGTLIIQTYVEMSSNLQKYLHIHIMLPVKNNILFHDEMMYQIFEANDDNHSQSIFFHEPHFTLMIIKIEENSPFVHLIGNTDVLQKIAASKFKKYFGNNDERLTSLENNHLIFEASINCRIAIIKIRSAIHKYINNLTGSKVIKKNNEINIDGLMHVVWQIEHEGILMDFYYVPTHYFGINNITFYLSYGSIIDPKKCNFLTKKIYHFDMKHDFDNIIVSCK